MPAVMKLRRQALDLTQPELAKLVGIGTRQIARYEAGEQQPAFNVAVKIADALEITVDQLAGNFALDENLGGAWWANWQIPLDTDTFYPHQHLDAIQRGERILLEAEQGYCKLPQASFSWVGEMRQIKREILIGWFQGTKEFSDVAGSFFLKLMNYGNTASGRWTGQIIGQQMRTGKFVLDRSRGNDSIAYPSAQEAANIRLSAREWRE